MNTMNNSNKSKLEEARDIYNRHVMWSIRPAIDDGWCVEPNTMTLDEFKKNLIEDNEFYMKWGNDIPKEIIIKW